MTGRDQARFAIPGVIDLAHEWVGNALSRFADTLPLRALDLTVGNGHDTGRLAAAVGQRGVVIGCDIQVEALFRTSLHLQSIGLMERVRLIQTDHAHLSGQLGSTWHGSVHAAMANLGYLPGGDKSRVTRGDTTEAMLRGVLPLLTLHGLLTVIVYSGHPGGAEELQVVTQVADSLQPSLWRVAQVSFPGRAHHSPTLFAFERMR
ncbi:MAG: class I SAM-dependent methyltransferase [Firmicutes bacterium]|nr:class I SAM-dependent methyltransferase [Bacillota bacterium]